MNFIDAIEPIIAKQQDAWIVKDKEGYSAVQQLHPPENWVAHFCFWCEEAVFMCHINSVWPLYMKLNLRRAVASRGVLTYE